MTNIFSHTYHVKNIKKIYNFSIYKLHETKKRLRKSAERWQTISPHSVKRKIKTFENFLCKFQETFFFKQLLSNALNTLTPDLQSESIISLKIVSASNIQELLSSKRKILNLSGTLELPFVKAIPWYYQYLFLCTTHILFHCMNHEKARFQYRKYDLHVKKLNCD